MKVKVDNVRITDLIHLLAQLSLRYDNVDIIVDDEARRVIVSPIEREIKTADVKLDDNNIDKFV